MKKFCLLSTFLLLNYVVSAQLTANCSGTSTSKILLAGDSWAQYMGDDDSHNTVIDGYGFADYELVTETLGSSPGPGYTGSAYSISGSEAREWANTTDYPYIQNMVDALQANPDIEWVILSIGGNDILAAKSGGGWYKDMDLDVAGSEQALFDVIEANTLTIVNAALAVRPNIKVLLSSYEYPNFDVEFGTCWAYACPKREDLSRDPDNDLITNEELNQMMLIVEAQRQQTVATTSGLYYDNSIGLMHHVYGDGNSGPGVLPAPEGTAPFTPGGNPLLPTLRENFRMWGDPIHLDADGYVCKVQNQMDNIFFPAFRSTPDATFYSEGGNFDGSVDIIANNVTTNGLRAGDDGGIFSGATNDWRAILSFDTGNLPDNAMVTGARLFLTKSGEGGGTNPFQLNDRVPLLAIKNGTFGGDAVELSDGTETSSADNVGCFHGEVASAFDVIRIDIHPTYLQHINLTGRTQFRLSFSVADWSANYVNFFDGSENGFNSGGQQRSARQRPAIVYQEKQVLQPNEDGGVDTLTVDIPAAAQYGVADVTGSTAPFLDISYELLLPVDLLDFTAMARANSAVLNWRTVNEENFRGFHLQRSLDGRNWTALTFLPGKGNGQTQETYDWIDPFPSQGRNYYRLEMEDLDGTLAYSGIRSLDFETPNTDLAVYPNPTKGDLQINCSGAMIEEMVLLDFLGRPLANWIFEANSSANIQLPADLPKGYYLLQVYTTTGMNVLKIAVE